MLDFAGQGLLQRDEDKQRCYDDQMTQCQVKLIDFGYIMEQDYLEGIAKDKSIHGTNWYHAPEVIK